MTLVIELKDKKLVEEAQNMGHHKDEAETVIAALQEYVERRKREQILTLFGSIEYDSAYDYKVQRQKP